MKLDLGKPIDARNVVGVSLMTSLSNGLYCIGDSRWNGLVNIFNRLYESLLVSVRAAIRDSLREVR